MRRQTHRRDPALEGWLSESASLHTPPQRHHGNNMAAYLPAPSIDAKRCQKGVEDHVAGLYVDW